VESSGRLVVIEVKLAGNAESRRAVVAQVLSYAGYMQGLDSGQLESQVLGPHLGGGSVLAAVQADDQEHSLDPAAFKDGLAASLAEGSFRLVIVLDSVPDELVQVVGYLQSLTDKVDIDLVTVVAYDVAGSQVLVPQRIEPARRVRELSDAQVNDRQAGIESAGSAAFRAAIVDVPADRRDLLEHLADWADTLERNGPGQTDQLPRQAWHRHPAAPPGQRQCRAGKHLQRRQVRLSAVLARGVRAPCAPLHTTCRRSTRNRTETRELNPHHHRRATARPRQRLPRGRWPITDKTQPFARLATPIAALCR
jgi:hypothetical protein